jgi:hypothetical protein
MKKIVCILICFVLLCLCGCRASEVNAVKDIAYNTNSNNVDDYTLYIKENGIYTPYLVLDDDYYGNALLLRKDILTKSRRVSEYSSYYEGSEIDTFLNGEYLNSFDENLKSKIASGALEIATNDSIGFSGSKSTVIIRKIFLLSYTEIGLGNSYNAANEGRHLEFFKNPANRIVCLNGTAVSWWLRSPNTYYTSCTYGVGPDGTVGSGNSSDENGIRPAFCLDGAAKIIKSGDIVKGKECWILA